MSNSKKHTLTVPESRADAVYIKVVRATVDFASGEVEGVYAKYDSGDNPVGSTRFTFVIPANKLAAIENEVLTEAAAAAAVPAGTVGDV